MTECECADPAGAGGFRLWPAFSVSALRRKLLEAMACGGGVSSSPNRHHHRSCRKNGPRPSPPPEAPRKPGGSEQLRELLKADASESGSDEAEEAETERKVEAFEELQRVIGRLQLDGDNVGEDQRREAAAEVRHLAKDDGDARETIALLGAIPPLVGMIDSDDAELQVTSLYALLNLGIGNDLNKGAILKAGAVHKMLHLIKSGSSPAVADAIVANFLGLSALDANKPIIGASGAIPFLLSAFQRCRPDDGSDSTAREDALRALFNLSIASANVPFLVDAGLVPALLSSIGDMSISERTLAVVCNLVATSEGRRAVSRTPDSFPVLVDVLGWCDAAGCQEKSAYVLMVMAHKGGRGDRAAMVESGIVSALLELTLIGSPLAQKRASRILAILTMGKGKGLLDAGESGVPAVSAPLYGATSPVDEVERKEEGLTEERRAVKELVQQSLHGNMRRMIRRANLPQDFAPSERLMTLIITSTSKSLPF